VDKPCAVVADDDFLVRMDASAMLEEAGFHALAVAGADQAMAVLSKQYDEVQILFTDVHMPGSSMDGFALARRVSVSWPHISIIVASGAAKPQEGDMPPQGCFIGKPFSAALVHSVLQDMLEAGQQPDQLKRRASKRG
jgi:CheY-like chemotaxis protein